MNVLVCTGLFPYHPFTEAWSDAIKTSNKQNLNTRAQYEAFAIPNDPKLSTASLQSCTKILQATDTIFMTMP